MLVSYAVAQAMIDAIAFALRLMPPTLAVFMRKLQIAL
jgi:hypothetical protein